MKVFKKIYRMILQLLFIVWTSLFLKDVIREFEICLYTNDKLGIIFTSSLIIIGLLLIYRLIYDFIDAIRNELK